MSNQLVSDIVLVAQNHHHVPAGRHRIDNVGGPDQSYLDFSGEHRLGRPRGDDENRLDFYIVFQKEALFPGHPRGSHIRVDGTVGENGFGGRIRGTAKTGGQSADQEGKQE